MNAAEPPYVAIMNDDPLVAGGLGAMLAPYWHRVEVVDVFCQGQPGRRVDVLLFDTFGHPGDLEVVLGLSLAERVVVYEWSANPAQARVVLHAGASGCLTKSLTAEQLVEAIERIHAGEKVISLGSGPSDGPGLEDWPGQASGLSPREGEIVAMIAAGHSNRHIARQMFLSVNTVKTYIRSAYRKMGAVTRTEAVLWAFDHGFSPRRPSQTRNVDPVVRQERSSAS